MQSNYTHLKNIFEYVEEHIHEKLAVFKYIGSKHSKYMTYENVADILEGIFIWLGQSEYCQAAPFVFEAIDASIATETYCEIDIHIPVKRKV